ncbi:MAG: LLM class flavin-dependent oxidoreductase [Christensenellaceae bacterium]|jgi:5,10-methylenetetrahydromethanopterin reductase|nr:LLM class flavin-dependent oxidoreductase [Christensenellaceae bacterium]
MKQKRNFGIGVLGETAIKKTVAYAALAERMGYGACWVAEDYFCGGAFTIATACAAATSNIDIGIGVLNPYTRHPALIAMEAAALHEYAGGRLLLGLGSSNAIWIEKQMGIPFGQILPSLEECTQILRGMFNGERINLDGQVFHTAGIVPKVPVHGKLPLIYGVKSEKLLRMAGRLADGVLLSVGTSAEYVRWVKEQLAVGAQEAGRELGDDFTIAAYLLFSIDEDRQRARERVKKKLAYYMGLHGDHPIMRRAGISAEKASLFREGFLQANPRVDLVTEDMLDKLTISGTPQECRARLQGLLDAGVTQPVVFEYDEMPMEENMASVRRYLFEVLE